MTTNSEDRETVLMARLYLLKRDPSVLTLELVGADRQGLSAMMAAGFRWGDAPSRAHHMNQIITSHSYGVWRPNAKRGPW